MFMFTQAYGPTAIYVTLVFKYSITYKILYIVVFSLFLLQLLLFPISLEILTPRIILNVIALI